MPLGGHFYTAANSGLAQAETDKPKIPMAIINLCIFPSTIKITYDLSKLLNIYSIKLLLINTSNKKARTGPALKTYFIEFFNDEYELTSQYPSLPTWKSQLYPHNSSMAKGHPLQVKSH